MNNLLQLFLLKMTDTIINSGKTIFLIKNMKFMSALSQSVSNIFYLVLMSKLMKSADMKSILVTSCAVFFGQYLSQWIAEKFDKDKVWRVSITPKSKSDGKDIADALALSNIPVQTFSCYSKKNKSLGVVAFAETKVESNIISSVLDNYPDAKFNIVQIKNRF